jgi:hypothetical protein
MNDIFDPGGLAIVEILAKLMEPYTAPRSTRDGGCGGYMLIRMFACARAVAAGR